jgi:hypothetical protein
MISQLSLNDSLQQYPNNMFMANSYYHFKLTESAVNVLEMVVLLYYLTNWKGFLERIVIVEWYIFLRRFHTSFLAK